MTFAELERVLESRKRTMAIQEKKQAIFDYKLADLIGRSVARIHSSNNRYPTLVEAYPNLFEDEVMDEKIQEQRDEISALRFKQFAQSYNKQYKEVGKINDE